MALEDVEEIVPGECKFQVVVQLSVPLFPTENRAKVRQVFFSLQKTEFDFDATWFTSHFHDLDQIWAKQREILQKVLKDTVLKSFESAITFNRPGIWLKKKVRQIDNQIMAAQNKKKNKSWEYFFIL